MQRKNLILLVVGAAALVAAAAGASAYVTRDVMTPDKQVVENTTTTKTATSVPVHAKKEQINWNQQQAARQPVQPAVPPCNDSNIVGAGLGAVGGGLVGHQFGKGKGNALTTIGGAIAGGVAGHEYIPTRNVTCR